MNSYGWVGQSFYNHNLCVIIDQGQVMLKEQRLPTIKNTTSNKSLGVSIFRIISRRCGIKCHDLPSSNWGRTRIAECNFESLEHQFNYRTFLEIY